VIAIQPVYGRVGRIYRKHSFLYCCVLDRVYRAVAWHLVDQIRHNTNGQCVNISSRACNNNFQEVLGIYCRSWLGIQWGLNLCFRVNVLCTRIIMTDYFHQHLESESVGNSATYMTNLLTNSLGLATAQAVSCPLPPRRSGFQTKLCHLWFVVEKVALGPIFFEYLGFLCQFSFHRLFNIHHLSSGGGKIGQLVADVPSGLSLTPPQGTKKTTYPLYPLFL
jgi:hypothetical protein